MLLKGFSILFADDRRDTRFLVDHLLRDAGAYVKCVENGQQALDAILGDSEGQTSYQVIILDVSMPVVDGLEVVTELRFKGIETPVLAVSSGVMEHDRIECFNAGFDDFLEKPINGQLLISKVRQLGRTGVVAQSR